MNMSRSGQRPSESDRRGPKFAEIRESLPEGQRPIYDRMVASYGFYCLKHHGRELVSYQIIADLVREGWQPGTDPSGKVKTRPRARPV